MSKRLFSGVLMIGLVVGAQAQTTGPLAIEERTLPSRSAQAAPAVSDEGLMLLMQQIQIQEQELATLRGQIEELRHELDTLRQAERERFIDLDMRINALAASSASSSAAAESVEKPDTAAPVKDPEADRASYTAAKDKLVSGKYEEAAKAFEGYLGSYPDGQFVSYSHFWLGEIYRAMAKPQPDKAMQHFSAVVDKHPDSPKVAAALYKLAVLQYEGGDATRAKVTLNKLVKQYPDSSEAGMARSMLEQLK